MSNLRSFFSTINREDFQLAWEPRGDWPPNLVEQLCNDLNLIHCVDPFKAKSVTARIYWRLHGRSGYGYRYTDQDLNDLLKMLHKDSDKTNSPAYILFNNIWMKDDALRFRDLMGSAVR